MKPYQLECLWLLSPCLETNGTIQRNTNTSRLAKNCLWRGWLLKNLQMLSILLLMMKGEDYFFYTKVDIFFENGRRTIHSMMYGFSSNSVKSDYCQFFFRNTVVRLKVLVERNDRYECPNNTNFYWILHRYIDILETCSFVIVLSLVRSPCCPLNIILS